MNDPELMKIELDKTEDTETKSKKIFFRAWWQWLVFYIVLGALLYLLFWLVFDDPTK